MRPTLAAAGELHLHTRRKRTVKEDRHERGAPIPQQHQEPGTGAPAVEVQAIGYMQAEQGQKEGHGESHHANRAEHGKEQQLRVVPEYPEALGDQFPRHENRILGIALTVNRNLQYNNCKLRYDAKKEGTTAAADRVIIEEYVCPNL